MNKLYYFVLIIFSISLIFYEMKFNYLLGIRSLISFYNFFVLIIFSYFSIKTLQKNNSKKLTLFFILPILLYLLGVLTNDFLSSLTDFSLLNQIGIHLPMIMVLGMPYLLHNLDQKKLITSLWNIYNRILFFCISIAIIEYYLASIGAISLKTINLGGTDFLHGWTTFYHELSSGEIHLRFYGAFNEPGSAAMFILPALVYSLVRGNYIFSLVYIIAIFLTKSLGGIISLLILFPLFIFLNFRSSKLKFSLVGIFILTLALNFGSISDFYINRSIQKMEGDTVDQRIQNVIKPINNIDKLFLNYPLGLKKEKTTNKLSENRLFFGYNFSLLTAFYNGGIFSFVGFSILLFTTYFIIFIQFIEKKIKSNYDIIIMISLITLFPFNFQRVPITGTILFSFLFAPYIIFLLDKKTN